MEEENVQMVPTSLQWHATTDLVGVDSMIFREPEEVYVQLSMVKKYISLEEVACSKFHHRFNHISIRAFVNKTLIHLTHIGKSRKLFPKNGR